MDKLINQLSQIEITPSPEWKLSARDFLLSEFAAGRPAHAEDYFSNNRAWYNMIHLPQLAWKPAGVFAMIALLILGGFGATVVIAQKAKPGDSLFAIKRSIEDIKLAAARDNIRKVALSNAILNNRVNELNDVLVLDDKSLAQNKVDLAMNEVEKQIKVVNSKFNDLKNENNEDNSAMVATALALTKKINGYRKELKKAEEKVASSAINSNKLKQVLNEVDDMNTEVLSAVVEKHTHGSAIDARDEIAASLGEHLGGISDKAEEILATLGSSDETALPQLVDQAKTAQIKIEQAGQALAKGEFSLVLTLADDSNAILKMLYGNLNEIIVNQNKAIQPEEPTLEVELEIEVKGDETTSTTVNDSFQNANPDVQTQAEVSQFYEKTKQNVSQDSVAPDLENQPTNEDNSNREFEVNIQ